MNAKKILTRLLVAALLLTSICSCSNNNKNQNSSQKTTDAPVDTSPVEIEDAGIDFWIENNAGFESAIVGTVEDFEIEAVNGTVTILSYKGTKEHLSIPAEINGLPVTAIADGAFAGPEKETTKEEDKTEAEGTTSETTAEESPKKEPQTLLKTLIIPESITTIGTGILARCDTLHSLQTPLMGANKESTQYLGYLFGATTHEDNARDIPASLKCLRITGEWQSMPAYSLFDCNDLVCISLPEDVTVLEKFALFNGASLRQIDGLENVTVFGDRALMNCSSLQTVTISNNAQSIGFGAFEGCDSLCAMTLPFAGYSHTENTYLAYIFGAAEPDFSQGFYPKDLAKITLTTVCKKLGDYAFFECETLKEISLSSTLEHIGVRAFYGCESLWSIQIPNSVMQIRELAFANCDALTEITFGTGLTTLGINAFYNCDSLVEVSLPASLKKIPASCFAGCISLESINLGGATEVGDQAFRHCSALKSVTSAGSVTFGEGNEQAKSILQGK